MIEAGARRRNQPAPPHVLHEALTQPHRSPDRPWLLLLDDEIPPQITSEAPDVVVWTSVWPRRPDAVVRFEIVSDGSSGTDLRWVLAVEPPLPDDALLGHMRKRLSQLINANLRYTFGQ